MSIPTVLQVSKGVDSPRGFMMIAIGPVLVHKARAQTLSRDCHCFVAEEASSKRRFVAL